MKRKRYEAMGRLMGYMLNRQRVLPTFLSPYAFAQVAYTAKHCHSGELHDIGFSQDLRYRMWKVSDTQIRIILFILYVIVLYATVTFYK